MLIITFGKQKINNWDKWKNYTKEVDYLRNYTTNTTFTEKAFGLVLDTLFGILSLLSVGYEGINKVVKNEKMGHLWSYIARTINSFYKR